MNKEERILLGELQKIFPQYIVRLEGVPDYDKDIIGVGIYGVEEDMVKNIQDAINHLEETMFPGKYLIPMVRSKSVTEKFYPEMMKK